MKVLKKYTINLNDAARSGTISSLLGDIFSSMFKSSKNDRAEIEMARKNSYVSSRLKTIYETTIEKLGKNPGSSAFVKIEKQDVEKFLSLLKGNQSVKFRVNTVNSLISKKDIVEVWYEKKDT